MLILFACIPAIIWVPEKMVQQAYHGDHEKSLLSGNNYAKLVDDYRKTIVQAIGGFLLFGTFYVGLQQLKFANEQLKIARRQLKFTSKQLNTTRFVSLRQLKFTSEQLKAARETQITDLFTKAVEYLGANNSQGNKQLETRLGGIYALERIAKGSPDDHGPIMEILTAYVRENSPRRGTEMAKAGSNGSNISQPDTDIQAIMTVIRRRERKQDRGILDLSLTDLRQANLRELHLEGVHFNGARLEEADLQGAHLEGASLKRSHLKRVILRNAVLKKADLYLGSLAEADLQEADLEGARLEQADAQDIDLRDANLKNANLVRVHLEAAILEGADLQGADLEGARLEGANLKGARLEGASLLYAEDVTQKQLDEAYGDHRTMLPDDGFPLLKRPDRWLKIPNEGTLDES